jgi:hypothetical protein
MFLGGFLFNWISSAVTFISLNEASCNKSFQLQSSHFVCCLFQLQNRLKTIDMSEHSASIYFDSKSFCQQSFCQKSFCEQSFCEQSFCEQSFCEQSFCEQLFCQQSFCQQSFCQVILRCQFIHSHLIIMKHHNYM